ncbi:MAG TPA: uridine kinase [Feifaniaceae bacterium]|nr:uridine kinase [Feifaniaceae bacterium]
MVIVGICGMSGSGKSTLAKRIRDSLSCSCHIIGQDCYYRDHPDLPFEQRARINYDEPAAFDHDALYQDVLTLASNRPITTKGYDYSQHRRSDRDTLLIEPSDVLLLEGIHMFRDERLCAMMSLKVYMHVDVDVCLLRRIRRDIRERGRDIDNIREQYLSTVKPMNEQYIMKYIQDADFAVMRGGKNVLAIDAVSAYLTAKVLAERFDKDGAQKQPQACAD